MSNISQSKSKMKFGQSVEYKRENFFFKHHAENKAGRLVPDHFLPFKKVLFEVKVCGLQLSFKIFRGPST